MKPGSTMRAAGTAAFAIAAVLLATACSSTPSRQAAKTTAHASAAVTNTVPANGPYQGTTNDGLPVSFTFDNNAITDIQFGWLAVCADGQLHQNMIQPGDGNASAGSFSVSGTLTTGAAAKFSGTISGDTSTGTFSRSGPSAFNTDCVESGTWKAHLTTPGGAPPVPSQSVLASSSSPSDVPAGPVQHHPRIFLLFWGPAWQSDSSGFPQAAQQLFEHLAGSFYNQIITQYGDASGTIANDASLAGVWNDNSPPPANVSASDFGTEISKAVSQNGWTVTQDTQFILFPQQGSSYSTKPGCGWHDDYPSGLQTYVYGVIPFTATGCNVPGTLASMARTTSHEYFEMATDPLVNAWTSANNNEIADLCVPFPNVTGPAGIPVIEIWSQDAGKCVSSASGYQPPAAFSAFARN